MKREKSQKFHGKMVRVFSFAAVPYSPYMYILEHDNKT